MIPNVALVRGRELNRFETQPFARMHARGSVRIRAIASTRPAHDLAEIGVPVVRLPVLAQYLPGPIGTRVARRPELDRLGSLVGLGAFTRRCSILHAADTFLPFTAQCAALRAARPHQRLVLTCWENIPFLHEEDELVRERKAFVKAHTDRFLAVTPEARDALVVEGVDPDRIRVVPVGVELSRFADATEGGLELRHELGIAADSLVVLYVGRLIREKGVLELIRSVAALADADVRCELVLVGSGPDEEKLRSVAQRLGIADHLHLTEFVPYDRIPAVHAMADVFVLPSLATPYWAEQFGVVLAEAMASGTPIVTTRTGSIPSVVEDGAVLVAGGDIAGLATAIGDLLDSPTRRAVLGDRARRRAETLSDEAIADVLESVYDDALRASR